MINKLRIIALSQIQNPKHTGENCSAQGILSHILPSHLLTIKM